MLCVQKLWKPVSPQQLRGKQIEWRTHSYKPNCKFLEFKETDQFNYSFWKQRSCDKMVITRLHRRAFVKLYNYPYLIKIFFIDSSFNIL